MGSGIIWRGGGHDPGLFLNLDLFYNPGKVNARAMKKRSAIVFLALLMVPPVAAAQEKPAPTFKIRVTAEQANIRDTPDIGSPIVQQLPEGTVLEAEKKEGDWYLVRFTRDDGLVARGYIHESLVQALEPLPEVPVEEVKVEPVKKEEAPPVKTGEAPAGRKTELIRKEENPVVPVVSVGRLATEPPGAKTFGFSILIGANFAAVGDLNAGARGLADYYGTVLGRQGKGSVSGLHLTYILGAEVSYSLMPGLTLSVGADYFSGRRTSRVDFAAGDLPDALVIKPKVQAMPFKVGIAYYPLPYLYVKGTLQYFFAKANYLYRFEKGTFWQEWQGDAKANGLGAGAAVGGEWEFYPGLFLVGEADFRFARIGGFKGKDISVNSDGESYTEQGTLYYFQAGAGSQENFPLVFIRSDVPTGAGVSAPREAKVNFSGMSLKAGIRVRF